MSGQGRWGPTARMRSAAHTDQREDLRWVSRSGLFGPWWSKGDQERLARRCRWRSLQPRGSSACQRCVRQRVVSWKSRPAASSSVNSPERMSASKRSLLPRQCGAHLRPPSRHVADAHAGEAGGPAVGVAEPAAVPGAAVRRHVRLHSHAVWSGPGCALADGGHGLAGNPSFCRGGEGRRGPRESEVNGRVEPAGRDKAGQRVRSGPGVPDMRGTGS